MGITARASFLPVAGRGAARDRGTSSRRYGQPAHRGGLPSGAASSPAGSWGTAPKRGALPLIEVNFDALPKDALPIYSYEAKWIWDKPEAPLGHLPAARRRSRPVLAAQVERTAPRRLPRPPLP